MADSSSFMDWSPATPIPRHNPYPDNYMPGGWPEESGESLTPTAGVFARRPAPSGFLPAAKRLCRGLGAAIAFGVQATTAVVTVPTYSIVRRIRQRRRQRARPQRRTRPLPESPWNRAIGWRERESMRMREDLRRHEAYDRYLNALAETAPVKTITHPSAQGRLYHVPNLLPTSVALTKRKRCIEATTEQKPPTSTPLVFAGMPQFAPPARESPDSATPNKQQRVLPPEPRNLFSLPRLDPSTLTARPPSPPTSESPPAPGDNQLQDHSGSDKGSDSDTSSIRSYYLRPKKLRLRYNRTKKSDDTKTSAAAVRTDTIGPSLVPPKAPAPPPPAIVVQETTAAVTTETRVTVDEDFLSPPRVKKRRVSTPRIKKILDEPGSPKTPGSEISSTCNCSPANLTPRAATEATSPGESHISSTCECSPGNLDLTPRAVTQETSPSSESHISSTCECSPGNLDLTPRATTQPRPPKSPNESDISSMFIGTPPDQEEDARLFARIMAAIGGSPTPAGKTAARYGNGHTTKPTSASDAEKSENNIVATNEETSIAQPKSDTAPSENNIVAIDEDDSITQPKSDTAPADNNIVAINEDNSTSQPTTDETTSDSSTPKRGHPEETAEQPTTSTRQESSTSEAANLQTPVQSLAKLTLEDPYTPDAPTPKASPHSAEKTQRVTRAEAKRLALLEEVQHYEIGPLEQEWEKKIQAALRSGHGDYKATDLTRVVPLLQGQGTDNWLNDEVINGYLKLVVEHGKKNDRPTQVPTHHAFVSFFYNNLEAKGYDSVKRWANRAKIGGKNLLETENVFIPINSGMHWTLCVVSGKNKTITHYNSLSGNGRKYVETVQKWVREELGSSYKEDEWKLDFKGESPQQQNMDDCGVFTITSARQIMLGLTPMSYNAGLIQLQRRRIVAELINGALLKSGMAA